MRHRSQRKPGLLKPDRTASRGAPIAGVMSAIGDTPLVRLKRTRVVAVDAFGSVLFGGHAHERKLPGMGAGSDLNLPKTSSQTWR